MAHLVEDLRTTSGFGRLQNTSPDHDEVNFRYRSIHQRGPFLMFELAVPDSAYLTYGDQMTVETVVLQE
jgi:hypothetical protein